MTTPQLIILLAIVLAVLGLGVAGLLI